MSAKENNNQFNSGIAVIGSGYWGKNLIRNFNSLGTLKIICEKNAVLLDQFRKQYPDVEISLAYSDVLNRDDIDAIVIATPAETHYHLVREALLSKKHVFVEKPFVLRQEDGRELISLAEEKQVILMIGHLLQYHPAFEKLKEIASSGSLGRINYIYSNRLNLGKIRHEENILWSFAPHDISMILSLAGEPPEAVSATGGCYLHQRIADVTTTHMTFPSGLRAHIFVSWLHPFKEQKLIVVGDRRMAVFDDTQPWSAKLKLYPHEIKWKGNVPIAAKADADLVPLADAEPLLLECRHFLNCIATGQKPVTDGNEALNVVKVLNACQTSLDNNGSVISMVSHDAHHCLVDDASAHEIHKADNINQVHETAVIDPGVIIGCDTRVWHFSHILSGSVIGQKCNIGQNVVIGPDVSIGSGCKIQNNVSVYKGVTLEDDVFCGPSMVFTNVVNPRAGIRRMDEVKPTKVGQGASLGANCTIVCGNAIGRYAFVAAGSVVIEEVPDFALVAGNPAKLKGWMCKCGVRLAFKKNHAICERCGDRYERQQDLIIPEN